MERRTGFTFAALTLWLLALALLRPLSIDESQYVASAALVARGLLPYRDFAYLQTPLQPILFAPLQWLFGGHLLIAMRMVNALLGVAVIMLVYGAALRVGAKQNTALLAAALLVTCESFIWCTAVARNDVLPAVLMALGLWLIAAGRGRFIAGLVFGLAASAKISYAVPSATVFLAGLWTRDGAERRRALWFAAGVAVGLVPTFLLAALAPRAFFAETIVFPATAPTQYYTEIGKAWRLGPDRFGRLLFTAAVGPALIASIEIACASWKGRWLLDPKRRMLVAAAVGGVISAALNKPFQIFYLLPALPPLFVLVALLFSADEARPRRLNAVWALNAAAILIPLASWASHALDARVLPALDAERRSRALAMALAEQRIDGPVATLAGQYVRSVDARFAAGPFLYRTMGFISAEQSRDWHIITEDKDAPLIEHPPAAIVTGNYPDSEPALENDLAAKARSLGYRPAAEAGGFTVWLRP